MVYNNLNKEIKQNNMFLNIFVLFLRDVLALYWFSFIFNYFSFRIHQFSFIFHAFFHHSSSGLFHVPLVFHYVPLVFHNVPLVFRYVPIFSTHVAVLFANSAGISNKRSCNTCTNGFLWFEQSQIYKYTIILEY